MLQFYTALNLTLKVACLSIIIIIVIVIATNIVVLTIVHYQSSPRDGAVAGETTTGC